MQQRRTAAGRPSGTDGSDFSYRMVVDPRYTKVAEGKSHLRNLIASQTVIHVLGSLWIFFVFSEGKNINQLAVVSVFVGLVSLVIGEIGRRHSQANLLRAYITGSMIATVLSFACMLSSGLFFKVIQYEKLSDAKSYELVEAGRNLIGFLLQMFVITTTLTLVRNMSPPKRAS